MNTKIIPTVFNCINSPRAMLLLLAATLLSGCSNIPKADFRALKANCPNLIEVTRFDRTTGVVAHVFIKKTPQISAKLNLARAVKQLTMGTNAILLAGADGKRLLEVETRQFLSPASPAQYYTLERLNLKEWSGVRDLTDEQLSKLALRHSSFPPEADCQPDLFYVHRYLDLPKSSRDHCNYKNLQIPNIPSYHYKLPNYSSNVKCPPPMR